MRKLIRSCLFTDDGLIVPRDLAAKIDETASFLNASQSGHIDMLAPFARKEYPEEAYIRELDGCKDGCIAQEAHHSQSCCSNLDQPW
jgi:hypothetical protein